MGRANDAAAVADEGLRRPVRPHRGAQDDEVGGRSCRGEIALARMVRLKVSRIEMTSTGLPVPSW